MHTPPAHVPWVFTARYPSSSVLCFPLGSVTDTSHCVLSLVGFVQWNVAVTGGVNVVPDGSSSTQVATLLLLLSKAMLQAPPAVGLADTMLMFVGVVRDPGGKVILMAGGEPGVLTVQLFCASRVPFAH